MELLEKAGQPAATEPIVVMDVLTTGITSVTFYNGLVRVTLHCDRPLPDGTIERIIVARHVMSEQDFRLAASAGFSAAMRLTAIGEGESDRLH